MSSVLGGCLDEPPQYRIPDQVPPVIVTSAVVPPLRKVISIDASREAIDFSVPFRSDDAGEDLLAYFVLDIDRRTSNKPNVDLLGFGVPALADSRPFAEQGLERKVEFKDWAPTAAGRPAPTANLHTVTMVLSHQSNFIGRTDELVDPLGAAEVTWFFDFSAVQE